MNGVDNLSYLNINTSAPTSSTVVPFTSVATPSAPTLSADNTGGSGTNITYRVSCNSTVGETAASAVLTVDTAKDRDLWSGTDNVVITLPAAPSGATSWNIYMGTVSGFEYLIASGVEISSTTFKDDGSFVQDTTRLYPTVNSTAGPKVMSGAAINGRAFLIGDKDSPYKVWYGGDTGSELDFSPANGGGYVLVGNGTKDLPIVVSSFRDGKGTPQVMVLCQGTNGRGKRFILTPDQITLGSTLITFYAVNEDNGQDGTESPDGAVLYGTDLHYPSRDGFKTTGTLPQIQNTLSTRRTTNTIQDKLKTLNKTAMNKCVGIGKEGRIYWALPVGSDSNSEIWVLDLDNKGAWMTPWNIAADWMWLYNDNDSGETRHLILSNNHIYELSEAALTSDNGTPFITEGESGEIYFSEDRRMWVQLLAVVVVLGSPQGETNWQIIGKTEDSSFQALGEPTQYIPDVDKTVAGWGETDQSIVGWGRNRWSEVDVIPLDTTGSTQEILIEVDEEVQWAKYTWSSSKAGVDYSLIDIIFEYIEVGIKDLQ